MILSLKPISSKLAAAGCIALAALGLLAVDWFSDTEVSAPAAPVVLGKPSNSSAASTGTPVVQGARRGGEGTAGIQSSGVSKIEMPPEFDLSKYPRGLRSQVDEVLEAGEQGQLAYELASILNKCRGVESRMDLIQQARPSVRDLRLSSYYEANYLELQKLAAQCQTLGGDLGSMRIRLLNLALQSGVVSSAAELYSEGVTDRRVLASILSDASAGDLSSIMRIAMVGREGAQFTSSQIALSRYVLLLALNDPAVGQLVAPLVGEVQRMGIVLGLAPGQASELEARLQAALATKSDVVSQSAAALDEAGKQEARAILQRMLKREARPTT